MAQGVGFEPVRPFTATKLAELPHQSKAKCYHYDIGLNEIFIWFVMVK